MFDGKNISITEVVEARKQKIESDDAWKLFSGAETLVVGRGKKVVVYDPKNDDKDQILKVCLGRTGNLRAPTLKMGKLVVVGFNDAMYDEYIG